MELGQQVGTAVRRPQVAPAPPQGWQEAGAGPEGEARGEARPETHLWKWSWRGRERRRDAGEQAGAAPGPPWLSPAGPSAHGEEGTEMGEGLQSQPLGRVEWARDQGTLSVSLGKTRGLGHLPGGGRASEPGRGHESGPSQAGQMAGQLPDGGMGREP